MSQTPSSSGADFISFNNRNDGNNKNFRPYQGNSNQFHPYHKNRNHNFRYDQYLGGRNDGDANFSPANFSSPVGGHQQRFGGGGFRQRNNNFSNNFQHRRNFTPSHRQNQQHQQPKHQRNEVPIQQYFHKSMVEDPWTECQKTNSNAFVGEKESNADDNTDDNAAATETIVEEEENQPSDVDSE